jgi:hypothetical protein
MTATRQVIQYAIQQLLRDHVEETFMLLREIGLQARLWYLISEKLDPKEVPCVFGSWAPFGGGVHQITL